MILAQAKREINKLKVEFDHIWDTKAEENARKGDKWFSSHNQFAAELENKGLTVTVTNKKNESLIVEIKRYNNTFDSMRNVSETISIKRKKDDEQVVSSYKFLSCSLEDGQKKYSDVLKEFIRDVRKNTPKNESILYQSALCEVCKSVMKREKQLENIHRKARKEKTDARDNSDNKLISYVLKRFRGGKE